jgi:hypothetical protein
MVCALLFSLVSGPAAAAAQIPVLLVSPVSLAFSADAMRPTAPQQVRIRNMGSGPLRWTARPDAPWIRVNPQAGSGAAVLTIEIDGAKLVPGRYEGRITIDAGDADDSPTTVRVAAEILPGPPPGAAPEATSAPPPAKGTRSAPAPPVPPTPPAPAAAPLRITRPTLPPATRNLPYAQAVPIAGGTPPYAIRILEGRLPAGLALSGGSISGTPRIHGYYPFMVMVTDASAPPAAVTQALALRVIILQTDTALQLDPPAVSLRLPGAGREGRTRLVIRSGRQPLDWTATSDSAWLSVVPAHGVSPAVVDVVASARGLAPGSHAGTITVTMEGAPNSPASIPVLITVPR